jgi:hypothetical protein
VLRSAVGDVGVMLLVPAVLAVTAAVVAAVAVLLGAGPGWSTAGSSTMTTPRTRWSPRSR